MAIWEHGLDLGIIGAIANISPSGTLLPPLQYQPSIDSVSRQTAAPVTCIDRQKSEPSTIATPAQSGLESA
jgi:hypothetical protein